MREQQNFLSVAFDKLINKQPELRILLKVAQNRTIYLVGGAIRDLLLKRCPCDFDFAVSGSGINFAKRFAKMINGSFILLSKRDDEARVVNRNKIIFDFNGFGDKVIYNDLMRRDFTINALALNLKNPLQLIDKISGLRHLRQRKIVSVSANALQLDPLRILRAFRLALELNFSIDKKIFILAQNLDLSSIAPERISYELLRICETTKSAGALKKLYELSILHQIFPFAQKLLADKTLFHHSLRTVKKIESILHRKSFFSQFSKEYTEYISRLPYQVALLKIAGLFHDIAKPDTQFETQEGDVHFYGHDHLGAKIIQKIAKENLRLSRKQTAMLKTLTANHMRLHLLATAPHLTDRAIRRFFRDLGEEYFGLMILTYADGYATARKTHHLERTISRMMQLKHTDDAKRKIKRLICGDDLIALGYKPGPIFKPILQELEELQTEGIIKTKEEGIEYVKNHFPKTH